MNEMVDEWMMYEMVLLWFAVVIAVMIAVVLGVVEF